MPTGYTADVGDGKVTEFSDFALTCARGFGALVLLRDSDQSLEATRTYIEEKAYLAKGGYYEKEIEVATARLAELEAMTYDEALAAAQARADEVEASNVRYSAERSVTRERYEAMLARVVAWEPPTEEHATFKEFMADQLRESIKFDCSPFAMTVPEVSLAEHLREIENQRARIARAADEIGKERARNEARATWVSALLDSLVTHNAPRTTPSEASDVRALRDLANGWREVSRRNRCDHDRLLRDEDPGPHMTAIQLEWAAREIERLRDVENV